MATWNLHSKRQTSTLHETEHNGCQIIRIRDNERIWNDSFVVKSDSGVLGTRASFAAAKKLAER